MKPVEQHRFSAALAAICIASSLTSCAYASRKQHAQLLIDSAKKLERSKTAHGTLALALKVEKSSQGFGAIAIRSLAAPPVALQLDFVGHRASAIQQPSGAVPPAVFIGPIVFLQRANAASAADSQFGVRSWSKLNFATVGKKETNTLGGVGVVNPINPTYLLRLLAGTLSGSVQRIGTVVIGGVATTHYRMNVDRAKAFSRLNDKDHQAVDKAFKSDNITGSVYKHAEVWVDAAGLPRRFIVRVHQQIDSDNVFGIVYSIDLVDFGPRVDIRAPSPDETAEVSNLNALLNGARS